MLSTRVSVRSDSSRGFQLHASKLTLMTLCRLTDFTFPLDRVIFTSLSWFNVCPSKIASALCVLHIAPVL